MAKNPVLHNSIERRLRFETCACFLTVGKCMSGNHPQLRMCSDDWLVRFNKKFFTCLASSFKQPTTRTCDDQLICFVLI